MKTIIQTMLACGATKAARLLTSETVLNDVFRKDCESNACGLYGKCYMCPPDVGEIHMLMDRIRGYTHAALYQTVHPLEDSYDYEGMVAAGEAHSGVTRSIEQELRKPGNPPYLHLSAGGCRVCPVCAKQENLPCRYPDLAIPSLESYGVDVYNTAQHAGLKYINGQNTVTYFGMVLWNEADEHPA